MANFVMILGFLGLGLLFQRLKGTPPGMAAALGHVVVCVSLPAVTFLRIHELTSFALLPILTPWVIVGLGAAFFAVAGHTLGWDRKKTGAMILCVSFGNTSFVGYPLIEAVFGKEAMPTAVLFDQGGSFPAVAIAGMAVLAFYSGRTVTRRSVLISMATFPPFVALLVAILLKRVTFATWITEGLEKVAATLVPLALLSVGLRLKLSLASVRRYGAELALGLGFKLAAVPTLFAIVGGAFFGLERLETRVTIAQAAMAPMITGAILAAKYDMEPELASLLVSVGIPISLLTVPLWAWITHGV